MKRFLCLLPMLFAVTNLLAQDTSSGDAAGAAGALIGGTCGCIGGLIGLAIWIFLVVYVFRDAKARGGGPTIRRRDDFVARHGTAKSYAHPAPQSLVMWRLAARRLPS